MQAREGADAVGRLARRQIASGSPRGIVPSLAKDVRRGGEQIG
jgi:hypothetical protein